MCEKGPTGDGVKKRIEQTTHVGLFHSSINVVHSSINVELNAFEELT